MHSFGIAAALSSPGGVRYCPSETGITLCYAEESLVHNILIIADVAHNIITLTKGGRDVE